MPGEADPGDDETVRTPSNSSFSNLKTGSLRSLKTPDGDRSPSAYTRVCNSIHTVRPVGLGANRGTGLVLVRDTMRSSLLSALLGLSLVGCVATIGDGKSDNTADDGTGDDGTGGGDDGTGTNPDPTATPELKVTPENAAVNTELGTTTMLTFDLKPTNFTGPATVAATVVDTAGAPLTGWTVAVASPNVSMTGNAMVPVIATLTIPSQNAGFLTANVKFDVTSSLGTVSTTSAITALNQVTVVVKENAGNGDCILPGEGAAQVNVNVKLGTKVRILNKFATDKIVIHSDNSNIIPHEGQGNAPVADTGPNEAYEYTPTVAGKVTWYCHAPASGNNAMKPSFTLVP